MRQENSNETVLRQMEIQQEDRTAGLEVEKAQGQEVMDPIFETDTDRAAESLVIRRLTDDSSPELRIFKMPAMNNFDYRVTADDIDDIAEVKTRKLPFGLMKTTYPEGLLLKVRKVEELAAARISTGATTATLYFGFQSGYGAIAGLNVESIDDQIRAGEIPTHIPRPRLNGRRPACDLEACVYVPWRQMDLILPPLPLHDRRTGCYTGGRPSLLLHSAKTP